MINVMTAFMRIVKRLLHSNTNTQHSTLNTLKHVLVAKQCFNVWEAKPMYKQNMNEHKPWK